jgi:hypothetical protein
MEKEKQWRKWYWEDSWQLIGILVVIATVVWFSYFTASKRELKSYYLGPTSYSAPAFCVRAEWTWDEDPVVFCTDDRDRAIDFVKRANETLKK